MSQRKSAPHGAILFYRISGLVTAALGLSGCMVSGAGDGPGSASSPGLAGVNDTSGAPGEAAASGGTTAVVTPFFSEDFESGMAGKQPAGWDTFLAWQKNVVNPFFDGTLALVDTLHAHGGHNAVHFHGGGSPAMLTRPLPAGTNKLYVRAWVFQARQLGMNPGANHETLIGIRKSAGSANDEVRFGEIKGVIGTNEVPTDNIAPKFAQWGMGPAFPPNTWACFEVAFLGGQPQHVLSAWINGTLVHSITAPDQWNNGPMPATWLNGKFVEVMFGWHSFSNITNDVWMDDIALAIERIGCN
jgi:hypothetical protein